MLRWKLMRNAEKKRKKQKALFTRYKNKWFVSLIQEATDRIYWTDWDTKRLKQLRIIIEIDYEVPINFFSAFVFYATYKYMHWNNRTLDFGNYVGFISNERVLVEFGNFLSSRKMLWRQKNNRWPSDWEEKWGIKTSIASQKLGKRDKIVEHDIGSDYIKRKINKHI